MRQAFVNNPLFRILWPAFYGVMVYFMILMVFDNIGQLGANFFNHEMWVCVALSYVFFEFIRLEIMLLQRFEGLKKKIWIWMFAQLGMSLLGSLIVVSGVLSFYIIEFIGYSFGTFDTELIAFNSIFAVTAILYCMVLFGVYFLNVKNEALLKKENTLRKNLELQVQSFNNDINPRFLYTCLETLISLLYKKGRDAEQFVAKLSSVYRYILQNKHNELSPLKEEIDSIHDLIFLFNSKLNNQITLRVSVEKGHEEKQLVTGTLSAVVEDIINNTIVSDHQPLKIHCEVEEGEYFVVKNKLNEKLLIDDSSRQRCERLKEAYVYFTSQPFFQVKAYNESFVKVPMISV